MWFRRQERFPWRVIVVVRLDIEGKLGFDKILSSKSIPQVRIRLFGR